MKSYYCKDKNKEAGKNVYSTDKGSEVCILVCDNCNQALEYCALLNKCEQNKGKLNRGEL